ncbi:SDR family NAD(P)-dependent oxidoreductase [Draconibacterium sediminis]|uniref:SDR family NAD(P)-dependent oxidoreductase n=1 Tax=Draconibacterium sediminis TaxID=1544798 RepID=UPI0005D3514C|nr:glucose 1-dehydrogenase [Draconibacterium sediminis]
MSNIDLTGKKALVTGGSKGIGAAICKELAACGADVLINYFSHKEEAEQLAKAVRLEYNVNTCVVGADVSNSQEVKQMFNVMDAELGGIDILVNNAGTESVIHVLDMAEREWDRVINTNLKGSFLCAQQAGRRMEKTGGGVIINISSIHDTTPRKGLIHYCSAKAGIKMLSKCLSLELAESNIRVVSVAPGAIETEMNREEIKKFGKEKFNNWIPSGRVGDVSEVAKTVAFMASDMADYINGADLYIDGAYMNHTIQYDPRPPRKKS